MENRLDAISLKTIHELDDFRPGQLTVLIGPNGAGKSNFLLSHARPYGVRPPLQLYVGQQSGASEILHDGPGCHSRNRWPGKIGLPTLRSKYAHFAEWLAKLEKLGK